MSKNYDSSNQGSETNESEKVQLLVTNLLKTDYDSQKKLFNLSNYTP